MGGIYCEAGIEKYVSPVEEINIFFIKVVFYFFSFVLSAFCCTLFSVMIVPSIVPPSRCTGSFLAHSVIVPVSFYSESSIREMLTASVPSFRVLGVTVNADSVILLDD